MADTDLGQLVVELIDGSAGSANLAQVVVETLQGVSVPADVAQVVIETLIPFYVIQRAVPIADVAAGGWTRENDSAVDLYLSINSDITAETVFIQSSAEPVEDECEFDLGPIDTPDPDKPVRLSIRARYVPD